MNLQELLKNIYNNNQSVEFAPLEPNPNLDSAGNRIVKDPSTVKIKDFRVDENNNVITPEEQQKQTANYLAQQQNAEQQQNKTLFDVLKGRLDGGLWGRTADMNNPELTKNEDGALVSGLGTEKVKNGFFDDLNAGMQENYTNNFDPSNWQPQKKNFANRLGEVLGTSAKIMSGPIGEAILYPVNNQLAYRLNQSRIADQAYRQLLNSSGINTKAVNGRIDANIASNLLLNNYRMNNLQVRRDIAGMSSNTQRAKMIAGMLNQGTMSPDEAMRLMNDYGITAEDLRTSNATRNTEINEYLAPHKANAYDTGAMVGLGNLGIKQELLPLQLEEMQASAMQKRNGAVGNMASIQAVNGQLDRFVNMFNSVPKDKASALASYAKTNSGFGGQDEVNFNAQRTLLFNKIARDLGGEKGVLSDQDMKRIELALPTLGDSYEQKQAKIKAVYSLIDDRIKQFNALNSGYVQPQAPRSGTTKSGIKYQVFN